jgi:hypothetical protein
VRGRWLPDIASALAVVIIAAFAVRPYVQTARAAWGQITKSVIAEYQRGNHLAVDPTRTYAETSLHWVFWYIGVPAVALGTLGAAVLVRRCLRGQAPAWTLPFMTFAWTIVTFLYQPAITPDQPWASRRLVPAVLPGFILLAVWASAWLTSWLREHGFAGVPSAGLAGCCAAALVLLTAMTTFGLGVKNGGPAGLRPTAKGLAFKTTYAGELGAVDQLCAAIPAGSPVVFIDGALADRFTEAVRGMCGDPAARATTTIWAPSVTSVRQVVRGIQRTGRRPVLLAASASEFQPYRGLPYRGLVRKVMTLSTTMDDSTLMGPPRNTVPLYSNIWMWEPTP